MAQNYEVDNGDIIKVEKGLRNIQMSTILELSKGLDVPPQELFDFEIDDKS